MDYYFRTATVDDAAAIAEIYGYYVDNTCVTFTQENPSVDHYKDSIVSTLENYPYIVVCDDSDRVIGFAYGGKLRPHDAYIYNVESSIYLAYDCPKRQGIGRALYIELMDQLAAMGYKYVYGVIEDSNAVSIAMHEALGFEKVGHFTNIGYKFDSWRGIVWYRKLIGNLEDMNLQGH